MSPPPGLGDLSPDSPYAVENIERELVIPYGATGYIALYRFDIQRDQVRALALRQQREIGYLP
jgi:hypothetical protein